ncbi:polysaccharide deacetylase family protein [Telmatobacter bradus]|uniref:polysaccharide deacetylase family protein n=1 Tax=Telmatobacter bradus TaxID=474953 RepID=UPI003B430A42
MRKFFLILVLVMGATAFAQSSYAPAAAKPATAKEDPVFATLRLQWADNLRSKQVEASVAAYAPNAVFLQPDGSTVQGTDALRKLYTTGTATYDSRILFFLSKVTVADDKATDAGQYRELLTSRADGKRQMIQGGYTTEYQRTADGKWLIAKQTWAIWGAPIALDLAAHPVVALTFDDLPAAGNAVPGLTRTQVATQLSSELKAAQMEGTYGFVNGVRMENNPDTAEALHVWLNTGMNIGSHTWSHPGLTQVTAEAYMADMAKNEPTLAQYGQLRDWRWFRYPYLWEGNTLEKRHAVRNWLKDHDYHVAQVTLDFEDYAWNSAYGRCLAKNDTSAIQWLHDSYLANAKEYIQLGREEEIIAFGHEIPNVLLMHETAFTAHMLPELISELKSEGFSFASLAQVESDPAYALDPDAALEHGGTLPDQFMDSKRLPYPPFDPKPFDKLNTLCN